VEEVSQFSAATRLVNFRFFRNNVSEQQSLQPAKLLAQVA
jgi:hypothetical protein